MKIKDLKLTDLYERYMTYIKSNYIYAIVNETTNTVSISFSGELARIFLKVDTEINAIIVKITQDPTIKMSKTNGKIYYLGTIDELNTLIAASKVILDLKLPESTSQVKMVETAMNGQGYLLNSNKEKMGVVDLRLIPTNAFVYETDMMNDDIQEQDIKPEKNIFQKSINKFFR